MFEVGDLIRLCMSEACVKGQEYYIIVEKHEESQYDPSGSGPYYDLLCLEDGKTYDKYPLSYEIGSVFWYEKV